MVTEKKPLNDSALARWSILILVSVAMAVNYYFYDALSPLKDVLEKELHWSPTDYGFLMSVYSVPNVFLAMAVIGGIIADKLGIRKTGIGFILSMVIGSFLTWYGATPAFNAGGLGYDALNSFMPSYSPALKMMTIGFFLFGLGAETTCVVVSKAVVKWFYKKETALALALNISIARLGTAMALIVSPRVMAPDFTRPIFLGFVLMAIGFIAYLVFCFFDAKLDKRAQDLAGVAEEDAPFRFADLGRLLTTPSYVYITLLCVTFYSAVFPFMKYAPSLMSNKYGVDPELAGTIVSILPFGTILFTPLFGWICDWFGKSATLMILGSALLICVHLMFALTPITPYIPMFVLGVAFSLVPAAMWPSVAKIVDQGKLGTAYGLMFSIQNIGLWLFPMLIGWVLDISNPGLAAQAAAGQDVAYDYTNPLLMLSALGVAGLFFAFQLKRADRTSGFGLEQPNKKA